MAQQQEQQAEERQASAESQPAESAAAADQEQDQADEPAAPTPALPDDRLLQACQGPPAAGACCQPVVPAPKAALLASVLLRSVAWQLPALCPGLPADPLRPPLLPPLAQAYKRDSSDEELLAVGLGRRAKDRRGKAPAREAEVVYEDSKVRLTLLPRCHPVHSTTCAATMPAGRPARILARPYAELSAPRGCCPWLVCPWLFGMRLSPALLRAPAVQPDRRKKKGVKLLVGGLSVVEQWERERQQVSRAYTVWYCVATAELLGLNVSKPVGCLPCEGCKAWDENSLFERLNVAAGAGGRAGRAGAAAAPAGKQPAGRQPGRLSPPPATRVSEHMPQAVPPASHIQRTACTLASLLCACPLPAWPKVCLAPALCTLNALPLMPSPCARVPGPWGECAGLSRPRGGAPTGQGGGPARTGQGGGPARAGRQAEAACGWVQAPGCALACVGALGPATCLWCWEARNALPKSRGLRMRSHGLPGRAVQERARGEDAERLARDRQSAATLSALRSFKAGEFRPGTSTAACSAVCACTARCRAGLPVHLWQATKAAQAWLWPIPRRHIFACELWCIPPCPAPRPPPRRRPLWALHCAGGEH